MLLVAAAQVHVANEHQKKYTCSSVKTDLPIVAELVEEVLQLRVAEVIRNAAVDISKSVEQVRVGIRWNRAPARAL